MDSLTLAGVFNSFAAVLVVFVWTTDSTSSVVELIVWLGVIVLLPLRRTKERECEYGENDAVGKLSET